jgi:hypothetical protein
MKAIGDMTTSDLLIRMLREWEESDFTHNTLLAAAEEIQRLTVLNEMLEKEVAILRENAEGDHKLIKALMAEQPAQQEPVAWKWENKETGKSGVYLENPDPFFDLSVASIYEWTHLYTSPQPAQQEPVCQWKREYDDHMPDTWRGDCGVLWTFTDGSPADNGMKYCCGCGAILLEKNT